MKASIKYVEVKIQAIDFKIWSRTGSVADVEEKNKNKCSVRYNRIDKFKRKINNLEYRNLGQFLTKSKINE